MKQKLLLFITVAFILIILTIKSIEYFHYINPEVNKPFFDFYYQYVAAQGALDRTHILYGYKNVNEFHPYPPFASVLYMPFLNFNYEIAGILFLILNIFLIGVTVLLFYKIFYIPKITDYFFTLILIITFLYQPLWMNFKNGQINIFICFIIALIYFLDKKNIKYNNHLISLIIAIGFLVKITPVFLLLYFLFKKNYKVIILTCLYTIFCIVFSLLFMEANEYKYFFRKVILNYVQNWWIVATLNCKSLYSYILRIFGHSLEYPEGIFYFPKLIKPLTLLLLLLFLFLIFLQKKFIANKNIETDYLFYSQIILFSQLCYSAAWNYTFINILFSIIAIAISVITQKKFSSCLIFLFAYLLLNITPDMTKLHYTNKYLLLLTSPQLFGMIILFFLNYTLITKSAASSKN